MRDILKKINKKEKVIIGLTLGVLVITFVSITLKDTHAFYSGKTELSLFSAKIGNFKPILNTFYIKDTNTPKYTNQNINTVYLTWGDNNKNINEMCITEGDVDSCSWQAISNNTQYTFANDTEGEKIVKGYVRDKVGNKSIEKSDTIIYDKTAPTIESATAEDITQTGFTINITANDNKEGVSKTSGIDKYCYGTEDSPLEEKYICVENSKILINNLQAGHSYTYYIYVKDKAGNGTPTNKQSIIFKTEDNSKPALEMLKEHATGGEESVTFTEVDVDGMYRYKGTATQVTNNYICFGTNNTETCKSNPDNFMYRIIGVTSKADNTLGLYANQFKIIKAKYLETSQEWYNGDTLDTKWDDSDMKTYLNTTFLTDMDSKWESPAYWKGLITSHKWYNADQPIDPFTLTEEPKTSWTDKTSQVGLMYATDYMNAYGNSTSNWLFIENGWNDNKPADEWTMSRYGVITDYNSFYAWGILGGTRAEVWWYDKNLRSSVRPVFYISPNITLTGEGSAENPFIIHS